MIVIIMIIYLFTATVHERMMHCDFFKDFPDAQVFPSVHDAVLFTQQSTKLWELALILCIFLLIELSENGNFPLPFTELWIMLVLMKSANFHVFFILRHFLKFFLSSIWQRRNIEILIFLLSFLVICGYLLCGIQL